MTVTIRLRSIIWFATGFLVALLVWWVVMSAWSAEAAPGDSDTTTVPITACRLADTRPANQVGPRDTPLGVEDIYTVDVQDASTGCAGKVPSEATGLVLNVTAAQTTAPTYLTVWDAGPWPGTSSMNPVPGPPVPNAVTTKLAGDDTFRIYNFAGSTHVIIDVVAYLTPQSLSELADQVAALQTDLEALEAGVAASQPVQVENRLAAVEAKTDAMSIEDAGATVRFTGVNVQIVDGSGDTDGAVNGRGNLIVGYNRDINDNDTRTGSHNLVVGDDHTFTSYGGFVAGLNNRIGGAWASVSGGGGNVVLGDYASVSGGENNTANAPFASVNGGIDNDAIGSHSAVLGGDRNTASGSQSTVSGGGGNTASGGESAVAGGNVNEASGGNSTVTGGRFNEAASGYASISGGFTNEATGVYSSVSGGVYNWATANSASILGGASNTASGFSSTVSGGGGVNPDNDLRYPIWGNNASGNMASVSGGRANVASGAHASVTGGGGNEASAQASSIQGGNLNTATGLASSLSGGLSRNVSGTFEWRAGSLTNDG